MNRSERLKLGARWLKIVAVMLLFFVVALTEYFIKEYQRSETAEDRRNASELAVQLASQLEVELHGATFLTHGIEAYIIARNGDIIAEEINSMLEQAYQFSPFFRNLGIAPDNTLFWIIPIEGNEAALGTRYEDLANQWPSIQNTIESRQPTLDGPLQLIQGGQGLIYRSPVYLNEKYWGMVSAVIDADRLFDALHKALKESELPAQIAIKHANAPLDGNNAIFLGSKAVFDNAVAQAAVNIPHSEWQLAVAMNTQNFNVWPARIGTYLFAIIGLLGLYYVARHFYQRQLLSSLSREVETRTKDLSRVNSKLNHVLNAATETAIIATDRKGCITLFNRGAELMLGYDASDVVGKTTPAIFHDPEEIKRREQSLFERFGRRISGFEVFSVIADTEGSEKEEWTYVTKSGKHIPVELIVTKEFNDDGDAVGYLGLASDISRHYEDQQTLKELTERLESATRVANIGVWELDLATNEMQLNEQMYRLTGLSRAQFDGSYASIEPVFYKEDGEAFAIIISKLKRRLLNSEPFAEAPPPLQTKFRVVRLDNHELRWMRGHAIIQLDEFGIPQSMLGAMHDVSSLVFAKEAAEKAEELKSQFLSTVSHELRTPLSVISGAVSLISLEQDKLSEETNNVISLAQRNSKRLAMLINDLLDIEKLTSGNLTFKLSIYPITELVENAIAENTGYASQHGASIKLNSRLASEVFVSVDQLRFTQVMTNLLSNAAKFSPPEGEIEVVMSIKGDTIVIEVFDEGPGVPEDFKARIFQPFAQAESSDSRNKGGTGLGLAISKTIIEKLGGNIGFDSAPRQRTRFYFSLPTAQVYDEAASFANQKEEHEQAVLKVSQSNTVQGRSRVLLVEDYEDFATVLCTTLQESYEIERAKSLAEAREKISSVRYDIIILDVVLPDGSGWDAVESIKNINPSAKIVVVSDFEVVSKYAETVDIIMDKASFSRLNFVKLINELSADIDNGNAHD